MRNISKIKRRSIGKVGRLGLAKEWLKEYKGNNIVNDYKMYFGVNEICVFSDLETLGMKFEEKYKTEIIEKMFQKEEQRRKIKKKGKGNKGTKRI